MTDGSFTGTASHTPQAVNVSLVATSKITGDSASMPIRISSVGSDQPVLVDRTAGIQVSPSDMVGIDLGLARDLFSVPSGLGLTYSAMAAGAGGADTPLPPSLALSAFHMADGSHLVLDAGNVPAGNVPVDLVATSGHGFTAHDYFTVNSAVGGDYSGPTVFRPV